MNRRGFLGAIVAAAAGPAIVRAHSLMPISVPPLVLYGDGIHNDTEALQAAVDGKRVIGIDGRVISRSAGGVLMLTGGTYLINKTIVVSRGPIVFENMIFMAAHPLDAMLRA